MFNSKVSERKKIRQTDKQYAVTHMPMSLVSRILDFILYTTVAFIITVNASLCVYVWIQPAESGST